MIKGVVRIFSWGGARFPEDFLGGGETDLGGGEAQICFARNAKKNFARSAKKILGFALP